MLSTKENRGLRPADEARSKLGMPAEEQAVSTVARLGGRLKFATSTPGGSVTDVSLFGTQVRDDDLESLKNMTELESLYLHNTNVSDAGLVHLKDLANLRLLVLGAGITDTGLELLAKMPQLAYVCVISKLLTLRGVESLRMALSQCEIDI